MSKVNTVIIGFFLLIVIIAHMWISSTKTTTTTTTASTFRTCGKEGHFSHSSGGGKFSWNAVHLNNHKGMSNPYLFIMFETYIDGTSDHYITGAIDLPTMSSDVVTADGNLGILHDNNFTVSAPDNASIPIINKAQKNFFDALPCYSGSYSGSGIQ